MTRTKPISYSRHLDLWFTQRGAIHRPAGSAGSTADGNSIVLRNSSVCALTEDERAAICAAAQEGVAPLESLIASEYVPRGRAAQQPFWARALAGGRRPPRPSQAGGRPADCPSNP